MRLSTGIFNLVYNPVQGANFAIVMDAFQWITLIVVLLLNKENLSLFKIDQLYLLIILVFGGVFRPAMRDEPIILYRAMTCPQ